MAQPQVVLDTDILSALMRSNPIVTSKARSYLAEHRQFTLSIVTRYEILRGLKAKGATKQAKTFDEFCEANIVLPLTDEAVVKAADIYADLRQRGELIPDADILIAASALANGLGLVTNNERDFGRIADLHLDNWMK